MKKRYFFLYCLIIALIITVPLLGTVINFASERIRGDKLLIEQELRGAITVPEKPVFSLENLLSGEFQEGVEDYFEFNLYPRRKLTRVYNQILYTLFHSTDNSEVLVGRENYIYEKLYATAYLDELTSEETEALAVQIWKLKELQTLLKERGVALVLRMSPSKAEHYPEFLPASYDRFVKMRQAGEYAPNWYIALKAIVGETDIPIYDGYELFEKMKAEGEIVFARGGSHWTLAPLAEYINGLNECMEGALGRKLGRLVVESKEVKFGEMGASDDSDIWDICWNATFAKPKFESPHMTFSSLPGDGTPFSVFTVGQSFTTLLLRLIYSPEYSAGPPVWDEAYWSWYNARVIKYPSEVPWGTQVSDTTDDYETYLGTDVILIDLPENGTGWTQFEFVDNMLNYLKGGEATP